MLIKSCLSKWVVIFFVFLFINDNFLLAQDNDYVLVWEDTLTLPTYIMDPPDVNPLFFRNQSYQGASRVIYPYPYQDNLTNIKKNRTYKALYLENRYIKLCVLPELGGKLFYATDKTNGYEIFYRQHVIKPAMIGMLGAWISGGIEFCVFHHHRASTFMPVDYTLVENGNGSKTIWIGETELRHRMRWIIGITLYPGRSYIEVTGKLINRTENFNSILYWANVATHANENYQVIFPPSVEHAVFHAKNSFAHWPVTREAYVGREYYLDNIDASWWKNHPEPVSFFAHNLKEGFLAGYDHGKGAGTIHIANHHIVAGAKLWEWGPGPRGAMWDTLVLTDDDGPYAELMTGAYSDNQPDYSWMSPYETKEFTQYWYPLRGIGGVKAANLNAAVNLQLENSNRAFLAVNTSGTFQNTRLQLLVDSDKIFEEIISIGPAKPFHTYVDFTREVKSQDLKVILLDENENELIVYQPRVPEKRDELPQTVEPPLAPAEITTVEELYLTGLRIKQFHHARQDPEAYFLEALKRDPSDIRCNTQMGILLKEKGKFEAALQHLQRAVERVTADYTHPRNAEPFYQLGLVLQTIGRKEEAYDLFYRATWDLGFRAASYYRLAQISSLREDYNMALDHVNKALAVNSFHLNALHLKCSLLRKLRRYDEAIRFIEKIIAKDPIDFCCLYERYLIFGERMQIDYQKNQLENLKIQMRDYPENYLELASEYMNNGLFYESLDILRLATNSTSTQLKGNPIINYYLGYLHDLLGEKEKAVDFFNRGKELSTDYAFPYRLEAIPVFQTAIKYDNTDARAHYYLGNLLFDKQPEWAIMEWEKSVELEPDLAIAHRNLGWAKYRFEQDLAKAIQCYEKAIETNWNQPKYYYELDLLYEQNGTPVSERHALLTKNHEIVSKREDALIREILVLVLSGDYDKALKYLASHFFHIQEGSAGLHDIYVDACIKRGIKYLSEGNNLQALADFVNADIYPENHQIGRDLHYIRDAQIHYYRGLAYELTGNYEKAGISFTRAAKSNPGESEFKYYKALALLKLDRKEESQGLFKELILLGEKKIALSGEMDFFASFGEGTSLSESIAQGHFMTGLGYKSLGNPEKANTHFKQVLQYDPYHLWAKEFLE